MVSLFPIYWLVAMAIRPTDEMRGHIALIPQSLTGIHFAELFSAKNFGTAIINSLQTTFGSLFVSLVVGICAAYIIARRRFRFGLKKPMTYWVLLVRVLPPVAFTIPLYIMFNKLGILNTKLPVLLACVLINVPLIIWFLISFFQDLPEAVGERGCRRNPRRCGSGREGKSILLPLPWQYLHRQVKKPCGQPGDLRHIKYLRPDANDDQIQHIVYRPHGKAGIGKR